ncbi:hypothetical protein FBQ88_12420 [Gammaproteobacteria bacterium PRO2]|nr:hypothetical protein [Gammaproteobacteria bacterium PRO2]
MTDQQNKGIRISLFIDTALLLAIIFQAGVGWSKITSLADEVASMRQQLTAERAVQPSVNERLARIEESLKYVRQDVAYLRDEVNDKDAKRR